MIICLQLYVFVFSFFFENYGQLMQLQMHTNRFI